MLAFARALQYNTRTAVFSQQLRVRDPVGAMASRLLQPRPILRSARRTKWFTVSSLPDIPRLPHLSPPPPPPIVKNTVDSEYDICKEHFMAAFPGIVKDLTDNKPYDLPYVTEWIEKVLQFNMMGGKFHRGLTLVHTYEMFCRQSELNTENVQLSYILGWCVEMMQTFQLLLDDIMDNSITRRGHICWHRHNKIGLMAINDGILLEQAIYQLIKKHFKDKPYYTRIMELFHEMTMKSSMGQCLDMSISNSFKYDKFANFTMKNYASIVKYKTAYYSFVLPVCLAMHMANMNDPGISPQAETVLLEMGHLFQVQDDFMDCYGSPSITGKVGTDIADGKCTWLIIAALQKANVEQRIMLEENFGIDDPAYSMVVRDVYEQLQIPNAFQLYEDENYEMICTHIQQLPKSLLQDLFLKFLKIHFKRAF